MRTGDFIQTKTKILDMNNQVKITRAENDNDLIVSWLSSKRSRLTQRQYLRNIEQFRQFCGLALREIKVEEIQDFLTMLAMKGYQPATIAQKFNSVKSLFAYALTVGYLPVNPTSILKPPVVHDRINQKLLTRTEIKTLIAQAKTKRDALLIKILFGLGLRVSEAVKLTWSDFWLNDQGSIKVRIIGKGNKQRNLLVPPQLYQELLTLKEGDNPFLFHAYQRRQPLRTNAVFYVLKKIAAQTGLTEKLSAHWLRHSHATESLKNGCDLSLLMQSLGHASLKTTQKYLCLRDNEGSATFIDF